MGEVIHHFTKNMETIELNDFVTACKPEIKDVTVFEHNIEDAQVKYMEKRQLVEDVFAHIGAEHYGEISNILHSKCFDGIDTEDTARHIMHRALIGTIISPDIESGQFIYDKHDKTLETILSYIAYAENKEMAIKIIDAIDVNFDEYDNSKGEN